MKILSILLIALALAASPVAGALRAADVSREKYPSLGERRLPTEDAPELHPSPGGRRLPTADRRSACDGYQVTATSYSWREPQHRRYGRLNACGWRLDDTQISADWRYYPPRTVIWIAGLGLRTVTDRGSAVRGPRHIDIHFSSLTAMRAWGTRRVEIRILRRT